MQKRDQPQTHNPALVVDAASHRILDANKAAARKYGYAHGDLVGLPLSSLWPGAELALSRARSAGPMLWRHKRRDGTPLDVQLEVREAGTAGARALSLVVVEVSERAFTLALLESQSRFLEVLAGGGALEKLLASLVVAIERLSSGMTGSVLLLDADGWHVRHGAAPNLPRTYWNAIDGASIGPAAGSCGTAMYARRQVIAADIERDPVWTPYRDLALKHGLRACWSTPIVSREGDVLGAFALYYQDVRKPSAREKELVALAAELAALAIERSARRRGPRPSGQEKHAMLSAREMEVLRALAQGTPVKRIATTLGVTVSTVYTHRASILEKLEARSDVDLARYAVRHGLVD